MTSSTKPNAATQSEPEPTENRGGYREGSGRKALPKREKLGKPAYVSLNPAEKREVKRRAKAAGMSISSYIRKRLGYSPVAMTHDE